MERVEEEHRDIRLHLQQQVDEHDVFRLEAGRHARRSRCSQRVPDELLHREQVVGPRACREGVPGRSVARF